MLALLTLLMLVLAAVPASGLAQVNPAPPARVPLAVRRDLNRAQAQLRQQVSRLPRDEDIEVLRTDDSVTLRVPTRILFGPDSESLTRDKAAARVLFLPERLLRLRRRLTAQIDVYTDNIGGRALNQTISQLRAATLLNVLTRAGISARRLQARGVGLSAAIASNDTPEGRMRNRRVEFVFERASKPPAAPSGGAQASAAAPFRPRPAGGRAGA